MGRFALLIAVMVLALVLAVGVALAAPTKTEFIRQGDALCLRAIDEMAPVMAQAQAAKSLPAAQQWAAATTLWTKQIRIAARFDARFAGLGVPAGDSAARSLTTGLYRGLVLARRVRDGYAARNATALATAVPAYVRYTMALNRRVAAYGFHVCGRS